MKYKVGDIVITNYGKGKIVEIREEDYLPYLVYLSEVNGSIWVSERELKLGEIKHLPKKYIINKGATILFWNDGTKTIVKKAKHDEYNKRLGFLTAYFQKTSGLSKSKANKYLDSLVDEDDYERKKKSN